MSSRSEYHHLDDLIESCKRIILYTAEMTLDDFSEDDRTVDAVLRNIIVLGEAVNRLPAAIIDDNPDIPWYSMRGLRKVVVHEYRDIDIAKLWQTVQLDIPSILPEISKLADDPAL